MVEAKKTIKTKKEAVEKSAVDKLAVIETGGKQYLVKPGDKIKIEKIEKPKRGNAVSFEKVLLVAKDGDVKIGAPYLKDAKIKGEWLAEKKAKKITNVRYKSKTRRHRTKGHRQIYTEVLIADF